MFSKAALHVQRELLPACVAPLQCIDESEGLASVHEHSEKFDPRTEEVFKYLQVLWPVLFGRVPLVGRWARALPT